MDVTNPVHIYRTERENATMNPYSQYSLTTTTDISQQNLEDIIENGMHKVCDSLWCLFYGAVALANIFCWAAALLYAQMGAKSVVISPPSLINTVHSQISLSACLISDCFVFNH